MKKKIKEIFKIIYTIFSTPELNILPGQLAFYLLMSIVPILVIVSVIASYLNINVNLISAIEEALPSAISSIILQFFTSDLPNISFIIILWCYLILATNGPSAIIVTSNELYKLKQPSFFHLKMKAFMMTIIMILLLLFMILIPIFGDTIIKFILGLFNNPEVFIKYAPIYKFIKILISFVFIYISIKLLYTIAPNAKIKSRSTTKGALFTTIGWIVFSELFAFYITKIADYSLLYGNFANVLILLLWVYLLAYVFVVGMIININMYNGKDKSK